MFQEASLERREAQAEQAYDKTKKADEELKRQAEEQAAAQPAKRPVGRPKRPRSLLLPGRCSGGSHPGSPARVVCPLMTKPRFPRVHYAEMPAGPSKGTAKE